MVAVDRLVVTWGSAGGTSTFVHVDAIAAAVGARHTVGMPDAGAFRVVSHGEQPGPCCNWTGIVACGNFDVTFLPRIPPRHVMCCTVIRASQHRAIGWQRKHSPAPFPLPVTRLQYPGVNVPHPTTKPDRMLANACVAIRWHGAARCG